MNGQRYAQGDSPLFPGYDDTNADNFAYRGWLPFEEEPISDDERQYFEDELTRQIQLAITGLQAIGVTPHFDYRDIEIHYRLTELGRYPT